METDKKRIKALNIRLPHDLWVYMQKAAIDRERSMNKIIEECLCDFRDRREKKLQKSDAMVESH